MTNLEKYKDIILYNIDIDGNTPAFKDGKITLCDYSCDNCEFNIENVNRHGKSCVVNFIEWLSERTE